MSASFDIVAHRGVTAGAPENTAPAFEQAIRLGADAIELDVRLTADKVPVVYHYYYLDGFTTGSGTIFRHTLAQLRDLDVPCRANPGAPAGKISTLSEILDQFGGRIAMEIEIKGPEPEAPEIVSGVLRQFRQHWSLIEVTSYEPALLTRVRELCPDLPVDLLYPRSPEWMKLDVAAYEAAQRARLAGARAVHLHPTQLSDEAIAVVHGAGVQIHCWDVNNRDDLRLIAAYGIPRICTDNPAQALEFRKRFDDLHVMRHASSVTSQP